MRRTSMSLLGLSATSRLRWSLLSNILTQATCGHLELSSTNSSLARFLSKERHKSWHLISSRKENSQFPTLLMSQQKTSSPSSLSSHQMRGLEPKTLMSFWCTHSLKELTSILLRIRPLQQARKLVSSWRKPKRSNKTSCPKTWKRLKSKSKIRLLKPRSPSSSPRWRTKT